MGLIEHKSNKKEYEKVVAISTTIPISLYKEIKENSWHFNELIISGVQQRKGMPQLTDRLGELEEGNQRLQRKLTQLSLALSEVNK